MRRDFIVIATLFFLRMHFVTFATSCMTAQFQSAAFQLKRILFLARANLPETSRAQESAFFREQFSQLRHGSGQLAKSIRQLRLSRRRRHCGVARKNLSGLRAAWRFTASPRFAVTIKPALESMKTPSLLPSFPSLALRNAKHARRMSERGNCFPFLRKVNGPRSLSARAAISPTYGSDVAGR